MFLIEEINDIMKIDKSLKDAGLLINGVTETVENEVKEQKRGLLGMLAATLAASFLGICWQELVMKLFKQVREQIEQDRNF